MGLTSGHPQSLCYGNVSRHLFFQGDMGIRKKPVLIAIKAIIRVSASICVRSKIGHAPDRLTTTLAYVHIRIFHRLYTEFVRFVEQQDTIPKGLSI